MRLLSLAAILLLASACEGRGPSGLLRSADMPILDFPMYMSDRGAGVVYKIERDGSYQTFVTGLNSPKGITTDKFQNLYIVESGETRLLKVNTLIEGPINVSVCTAGSNSECEIVNDVFQAPSNVATDSANEVYVTDDSTNSIIRANDNQTIATYSSTPSSLQFGVNDIMVVALADENKVIWANESVSTQIYGPIGVSIDGTGRVYAIPSAGGSNFSDCSSHFEGINSQGNKVQYTDIEGSQSYVNVTRYNQLEAGSDCGELVVQGVPAVNGVAVDTVGNVFVTQQGNLVADPPVTRGIILSPFSGNPTEFLTNSSFDIPDGITFTKY